MVLNKIGLLNASSGDVHWVLIWVFRDIYAESVTLGCTLRALTNCSQRKAS